ncbi:MurR/RpiR family transcriptional regulator [Rhodospirillaceae bacterium SYSU D60014]|uniref:MurR/RpiR family transcriptional regulator n=1 Tax=Virgifigura deserti TaxID=2268457 RepID=UPI000E662F17
METLEDSSQSMGTGDGPGLEARLQEHYDDLPPAEKRLGDLLLGFPGDIATYSATELAEMAGTSKAAATRLFQRLGYKDFNEVRQHVRDARRWGSPVYLASRAQKSEARSEIIGEQLQQDTAILTATLESLDPEVLHEAVEAIAKARRVFVVGFRNSHIFALYLFRQLLLIRENVTLLPTGGQTLGEDLADLSADDMFVVIGLRRRVVIVSKILELAARAGAKILFIADPSANRSRRLATWTIACEVRGISLFDSYVAVLSVLNMLCISLFRQGMRNGYARLRRIEELHDELDELDTAARFGSEIPE